MSIKIFLKINLWKLMSHFNPRFHSTSQIFLDVWNLINFSDQTQRDRCEPHSNPAYPDMTWPDLRSPDLTLVQWLTNLTSFCLVLYWWYGHDLAQEHSGSNFVLNTPVAVWGGSLQKTLSGMLLNDIGTYVASAKSGPLIRPETPSVVA